MHDIPNISFTDEHLSTESKILAIHDISDGGLVTCLLEMAIAGWGGLAVDLPPAPAPSPTSQDKVPPTLAALFSEEVGYIGYVKFAGLVFVLSVSALHYPPNKKPEQSKK